MKNIRFLSQFISLSFVGFFSSSVFASSDIAVCPSHISANYSQPTQRYDHGVLGDTTEYGALQVEITDCTDKLHVDQAVLPQHLVFEDLAPRLVDLDADQQTEIIVVEASASEGARLAVWGIVDNKLIRIAATPFIGRAYRWLAPVGAADFDNDGHIEIAYIDRPHLAQTLRVWRFKDQSLTQIASRSGFTNHRIGEDFISGGIRNCGEGFEIITADSGWSNVVATRLNQVSLISNVLGKFKGQQSFVKALACDELNQ